MNRLWAVLLVLAFCSVFTFAGGREANPPSPLLHMVRLKPGEAGRVELALPFGGVEFRSGGASGRDFLFVETLPKAVGGAMTAKGKPIEHDKKVFQLTPELRLIWVLDRPEIEFLANETAKPGITDVKLSYESFGGGTYIGGYRVVVEAK